MSFDRFAGVCHSEKRVLRSRRIAFCILIGMAIYALIALCPLLYNFEAREVILFQKATGPNKVTRMRIEKCTMLDMMRWTFTLFTCFLFVLCYLVPLFLVTFFYTKLLSKLHHHARQFKSSQIRSQIPLLRISLYTLAVACFYFICWTPFWVATAFAVYLEYAGEPNGQVPPVFVYFMYFIHALPFTNSAVNWILYGALNGQLQQRVRHGTVHGGGVNGALTSVSVALNRTQNEFERPTMTMIMNGHLGNHIHNQHSSTSGLGTTLHTTTTTLVKSNGSLANMVPLAAQGHRHSPSMDSAGTTNANPKRASITPAQSIQPNSSVSSLARLVAAKERRPSCPTGGVEMQQMEPATANGQPLTGKRYRRRWSGRNGQPHQQQQLEQGQEQQKETIGNGIGIGNHTPAAANNEQNFWNDMNGGEHYAEEEDEEQSLLLHSTDSVNCLLRIDSQTSTFL